MPTSSDCLLAEPKDESSGLLRPSSTQAEPATPPKWMAEEEAERQVKLATERVQEDEPEGKGKKDHSTGEYLFQHIILLTS